MPRNKKRFRVGGDFGRGLGLLRMRGGHTLAILRICLIVGLLSWLAIVVAFAWMQTPPLSAGAFVRYNAASVIDWISPFLSARLGWSVPTDAGPLRVPFETILTDPWHQARAGLFWQSMLFGMITATGAVIMIGYPAFSLMQQHGQRARQSEITRGKGLATDQELRSLLIEEGRASDLEVGNIPLVRDTEIYNILFAGSPGTGKTQAIMRLLDRIKERGDTAIVYDTKGALLSRHMDPDRGDILLNPLDRRSAPWSPWADLDKATHPQEFVNAMIPESSKSESFWHTAARVLLREVMMVQFDDPDRSITKLINTILNTSIDDLRRLLKGTEAEPYLEEGLEKMRGSIQSNLSTYLTPLKFLKPNAGGPSDLSIRQFIRTNADVGNRRRPWLWLTSQSDDHDAIQPLLSCWIGLAASAVLSLPTNTERRVWFILDEVGTLGRVAKLTKLVSTGREFGGAVVLGLQDIAQIESIYGHANMRTLLGVLATKVIFRTDGYESSRWASDTIGEVEISEVNESARYDPGDTESDIHFSSHTRVKQLVMPAEVTNLPDLTCYVKLPGGLPVARTTLPDPESFDRPYRHKDFDPSGSWSLKRRPVQADRDHTADVSTAEPPSRNEGEGRTEQQEEPKLDLQAPRKRRFA